MPRGRPVGSKSKTKAGYNARTRKIKQQYGKNIFKRWGRMGGNPELLKKSKGKRG